MDCGNNPCDFAPDLSGQRTQGRCRCWEQAPGGTPDLRVFVRRVVSEYRDCLRQAEAEIERLRGDLAEAKRLADAMQASGELALRRAEESEAEIERLRDQGRVEG